METSNTKTEPKIPPIFVQNMTSYTATLNNNNTRTNTSCNKLMCKITTNSSIKMKTQSVVASGKLLQHFMQNIVEFHT